jgi:glycine oxidase
MEQSTDVVIVGAGVIGCAIAYALRKQGIDVVVLDRDEVGTQASQAATGMLAPLRPFAKPDDAYTMLLLSSLALFPALVSELEEASGICLEYERTGTLRLMRSRQLQRLHSWVIQWQQEGQHVEMLTGDEIRQYEPGLAPSLSLALYYPQDVQLNAFRLTQAYACAAEKLGATFYEHEEVIGFIRHHDRISGVLTAQGKRFACNHLVLATGAWAAKSAAWLDITLPVYPLRGQSIAMKQPPTPIRHMLFGEGIYLAPKGDGTVIAAVARDEAGFDMQTTPEGITWLHDTACRLIPELKLCSIERAWAGLLPKTPDARPILGLAPGWENVILACGYNGYGVLLSALTGPIIADCIITGQVPACIRPFTLAARRKRENKRVAFD